MPTIRPIALLLAALLPSAARAQAPTDSIKPRFTFGSSQITLGYTRFSFPELDAKFAAAGLPGVAKSALTAGIAADIRRGRGLFGAGYQSLVTRDHSDATYRTRTSGSYSLVDFGWAVARAGGVSIYPIVGVGLSRLSVSVRERGDFAFEDGLAAPLRAIEMSGTAALAHTGLIIEQRLRRREAEYAISLRVGMTRTVGSQLWMSDESRVNGGPNNVRATYARLSFSRPIRSRRDAVMPIAGAALGAVLR
jgi:hypothetical protein